MYPDWVILVILGGLGIWLAVLSLLVWQEYNFFRSLFPNSGKRDIRKKFEEILKSIEEFKMQLDGIGKRIEGIRIEGLAHVQKVALVRFNPYNDTGGNISFSACLLNNEGSGIVITSLHSRSATRVFGKEVVLGKSKNQELSKEEELAIKQAMGKN